MRLLQYLAEAKNITLFHGTCPTSAKELIQSGWKPNSGFQGGNVGQTKYLYVTNFLENAEWFANEKGCSTVIEIKNVPLSYFDVDPEDGIGKNVADELNKSKKNNIPAYLVIKKPLNSTHFKIIKK